MEHEVLTNTRMSAPGGVEAAQLVVAKDIDVVLAGVIGPNSSKLLSQAGILIIKCVQGSVREAVGSFLKGDL
jgi:predicted Fe-Mo cluster-binding NifX family protein